MDDTSGMLPNWLSTAVEDQHDAKKIAQTIHDSEDWLDIIEEAVKKAEQTMHVRQSVPVHAGGFPSYNQEVAKAIVTQLVCLYPEISLPAGNPSVPQSEGGQT